MIEDLLYPKLQKIKLDVKVHYDGSHFKILATDPSTHMSVGVVGVGTSLDLAKADLVTKIREQHRKERVQTVARKELGEQMVIEVYDDTLS